MYRKFLENETTGEISAGLKTHILYIFSKKLANVLLKM